MDTLVYDRLRKIVYEQSGISIKEGKMSMVAARIARRLRALNLADELAYVEYLETAMIEEEIVHLLDAISTNVTHFFRESHHFVKVREAFGAWLEAGQKRFRFWSAASSTGEEPYTLAMTLLAEAQERGCKPDIKILATDISTRVLEEAQAGVYPAQRVEPIPAVLRNKYMTRDQERGHEVYRMTQAVRDLVVFRRMNLSQPPFVMKGPMDIILCRNVMIYFDQPVRHGLLKEFHRLLRPDGFLMVGHSESLTQVADMFAREGSSIYRPIKSL
jgi:chemotaxis protein methyltransferase CheR